MQQEPPVRTDVVQSISASDFLGYQQGDAPVDSPLLAEHLARLDAKGNPDQHVAGIKEEQQAEFTVNTTANEFPLDGLVPWARKIVEDVARAYQTPVDYVAGAMLSAVATLTAKKYELNDGTHRNPPQVWIGLVGRDGAGKSDAISFFFDTIRDELDIPRDKQYQANMAKWREAGNSALPHPARHRYLIGDITAEQRDALLYESGALTEVSDELVTFFGNLNRYAKSGEITNLISIFSNKSYSVDRKTRASYIIRHPIFSICGGLQPAIIPRELGKAEFDGNGFRPRWLWAWPNHIEKRSHTLETIPQNTVDLWKSVVHALDQNNKHVCLTLSQDASAMYSDFCDSLAERAAAMPGGENSPAWGIAAKMNIHVQRLALIIQILGNHKQTKVGARAMEYAIKLAEYFWTNALRVEDLIAKDRGATRMMVAGSRNAIRAIAKEYPNINQSLLAKAIGITQPYISKIINGKK